MRNAITLAAVSMLLLAPQAMAEGWGVPPIPKQNSIPPVDTKIPKSDKIPPVKNTLPKEKPIPKVKGKLDASGKTKKGKGAKVKGDGTIIRDQNGNITGITYPSGKSASFGYGQDGALNKIEMGGFTFEKGADGSWTASGGDKNGTLDGVNINVNANGTLRFEDSDGNVTLQRADGSRTTLGADGSRVDSDGGGHTNDVRYPSGGSAHASYDGEGNLDGIKASNGGSIERGDDGAWRTFDDKGEPSPPLDGKFSVDDSGDINFEKDGTTSTRHSDGSDSTSYDDGSSVHRDSTGKVDGVDYPDGKSADISYDRNGNVNGIAYGDSELSKGSDGKWRDGDGQEVPGAWVKVDQESGDITMKSVDGYTVTKFSDGGHEVTDPKGRKIGIE